MWKKGDPDFYQLLMTHVDNAILIKRHPIEYFENRSGTNHAN